MIAHHMAGGSYAWILTTHQNAVSFLSSMISVFGLMSAIALLCSISNSTQDEAKESFQHEIVIEYLHNHEDAPQKQITFCALLLAVLPKQSTREQVGAFINLFISFGLGLIILTVLSAITLICYPRRADSNEEDTLERRKNSRGFRLLKLGLMLRRYHVRLQAEDPCEDTGDGATSEWWVPEPGVPNNSETYYPRRKVADKCAICLEFYVAGDKVAYSSNTACPHVFHEKCCTSWIIASASQQCPCCRQTFLSLTDLPDAAKKMMC